MKVGHKNFAQKRPDQLVYLELGAGNGGMLLSISEDGFRFRAVAPLRPNGLVPFAFSLDGSKRLEGTGEIEWLEDDGKSGGMRFTEVSTDFRSSLNHWLAGHGAQGDARRELIPAAAKPLDTLEKIRQELRSGYPSSRKSPSPVPAPASPVVQATASETPPIPSEPVRLRASDPTVLDLAPQPQESLQQNSALEAEGEFKESAATASKPLSPAPSPVLTEDPQSATISSAFLKLRKDSQARTNPPSLTPPHVTVPEAFHLPALVAAFERAEPPVTTESRPYVPPLEESFEQAWERAKDANPPESQKLSRTVAGGIITIALAVILGALGYSFRQDIGGLFIDLGQRISGGNSPSSTVPLVETQSLPQASNKDTPGKPGQSGGQSQTLPSDTIPNSNASNSQPNPTVPAGNDKPDAGQTSGNGAASNGNANGVIRTPAKPPDTSRALSAPTANRSSPTTARPQPSSPAPVQNAEASRDSLVQESATGQAEFNLANEILRGNNRRRDLPKAVDLLWNGVKKGYVPAEVMLADLYLRGDGVQASCDQARILLVAASKKGSTDARRKLEQLAEKGCS